jgi:hypothetical protein
MADATAEVSKASNEAHSSVMSDPTGKFADIRKTIAGEAVIVFLITCGTYLTVYTYEAGYCAYFGIPLALIRLEISTVLLFAATFGMIGWLSIQIAFMYPSIRMFLERRKNPILRRALINTFPLLLVGVFLWLFTGNWGVIVATCIVVGLFSILLFVGGGTPEDRLRQWDEEVGRTGAFPFLARRRMHQLGLQWVVTVLTWGFVLFLSCYSFGQAAAKKQRNLLITDATEPKAVLRIYGEQFICADLDLTARTCSHKFSFIKSSETDRVFELRSVGPLKPQSIEAAKP